MKWIQHGKQEAPEGAWLLVYAYWRTAVQCPFVVAKREGGSFTTGDITWTATPDDWWCLIPRGA